MLAGEDFNRLAFSSDSSLLGWVDRVDCADDPALGHPRASVLDLRTLQRSTIAWQDSAQQPCWPTPCFLPGSQKCVWPLAELDPCTPRCAPKLGLASGSV